MSTFFHAASFAGLSAPRSLLPWWKKTKTLRPDVAFDFQGLLRSALIGRVSRRARVLGNERRPRRVAALLSSRRQSRSPCPRRRTIFEACGSVWRAHQQPLRFPLPTGDALPRFDTYPPFVLLHPFARGARKSLSNSVIEEFCRAFDPIRVVIVGQNIAQDRCRRITA